MRMTWKRLAVHTLIVTLGTPATLAFADDRSGDKKNRPVVSAAEPAPVAAPVASEDSVVRTNGPVDEPMLKKDGSFKAAIERAARAAVTQQTSGLNQGPGAQARPGMSRPKSKGVRAQYGGGGAGQMVMMLVSTVVGLAATVYMIRYMTKQQENTEEPPAGARR